jgi:hypothetical protein
VPAQKEAKEQETGRIVMFPTRASPGKGMARQQEAGETTPDDAEVGDLRKYEHNAEPDDYTRRMVINVIAFAFIVMLTLAGIWIADQLALLSKHQDCVFFGRKNCTDVDWNRRGR